MDTPPSGRLVPTVTLTLGFLSHLRGPLAKGRPRALLLAHSPQRLSELWGWAGQQGLNLHLASHISLGCFCFVFKFRPKNLRCFLPLQGPPAEDRASDRGPRW